MSCTASSCSRVSKCRARCPWRAQDGSNVSRGPNPASASTLHGVLTHARCARRRPPRSRVATCSAGPRRPACKRPGVLGPRWPALSSRAADARRFVCFQTWFSLCTVAAAHTTAGASPTMRLCRCLPARVRAGAHDVRWRRRACGLPHTVAPLHGAAPASPTRPSSRQRRAIAFSMTSSWGRGGIGVSSSASQWQRLGRVIAPNTTDLAGRPP